MEVFLTPLGDLITCNMETNYWENQKNNLLAIISALPLFLCISSPLRFSCFLRTNKSAAIPAPQL